MYKVFETRFANSTDAIEYLNKAHWTYKGRKGWFRPYDKYVGSRIYQIAGDLDHRDREDAFTAKLTGDGYLSLHVGRSSTLHGGGLGNLPEYVWPSLENYTKMMALVSIVNDKLNETNAGIFVAFSHRPEEYPVYSNDGGEILETLEFPTHAFHSAFNKNKLSEQEEDKLFYSWLNS